MPIHGISLGIYRAGINLPFISLSLATEWSSEEISQVNHIQPLMRFLAGSVVATLTGLYLLGQFKCGVFRLNTPHLKRVSIDTY